NATILAGIKPGVSQEELIVAFRAQEYDRVMPRHPIQAGDTVYFVVGGAGPHFALERWTITEPHHEPAHTGHCLTISNLGEAVRFDCTAGTTILNRAESCVIPAATGPFTITPRNTGDLIVCYVPAPGRGVIAPLRAAGQPDDAIAALGETGLPRS
ncbi:MAG: hypothetical protein ACRDJH_06995, partial [Thermomicrobiales bacterium]